MLFFRKPNPPKTFDYKQFIMINKQFKKEFKSIFNTLDYFNNSILKITSLELPTLLIDIEDYVRKLNQTYLAESNYNSRATYSYLSNLEQKALIIEVKTSEKTEKLITLYINEEKVSKLHYEDFKELLNKYYTKSIFLENFFEKLDKKVIEMTEHQIKRTHFLIDDEIEKDKMEKFNETVNKDVKNQENSNDNNSNTTGNSGSTPNTPNYGTTVKLPPYSKVSEKEVEIRFTDNNIILERYIIEKGSIPKFPAIPRKDGYVFVEWDKNVFTKVYENTTYVAKWISYKDLGTRVICSFDLDGGIGTFPSAIVDKGTTVAEILEKNGLTSPIRQGYIFKGWNIENTTKITEDIVVKALWSRVE